MRLGYPDRWTRFDCEDKQFFGSALHARSTYPFSPTVGESTVNDLFLSYVSGQGKVR